jgi:hypothetical protein
MASTNLEPTSTAATSPVDAASKPSPSDVGLSRFSVVLSVAAAISFAALAVLYLLVFDDAKRDSFQTNIGTSLLQIVTVAIIGGLIKVLGDDYQRRLNQEANDRARAEQEERRFEDFRVEKTQRLAGVTNVLRRAPILIEADRTWEIYDQQMQQIVDAGLDLRLIRHETEALGERRPLVFPEWSEILKAICAMEGYIDLIVLEFRARSAELREGIAEARTTSRKETWRRIREHPAVADLLSEVGPDRASTRFNSDFNEPYNTALGFMITASMCPPTSGLSDRSSRKSGPRVGR